MISIISDTDENYLKWIAPSKYGTTHGAELIHEFGAFKNEEYGEPFVWEFDAGETFGSRINAIVNSDPSLSHLEWKSYSENQSFSIIRKLDPRNSAKGPHLPGISINYVS